MLIRDRGRTLRKWKGEWYAWKNGTYAAITDDYLRSRITHSIKEEFDRLNIEAINNYLERKRFGEIDETNDKGPPEAKKVGTHLVNAVLSATASLTIISDTIEFGTWLADRTRRNYLSMANGILDIDVALEILSGTGPTPDDRQYLLPHSPEWFSTVSVPYAFDEDAGVDPPKWMAYLNRVLEDDQERIAVLQEWAGYLLLPDTSRQRFLVAEGDGANGKSVYAAAMTAMLGKANVSNVQLEVFGDQFSRTATIGKLANICGDVGEIDKISEGYVKSFTSGDRMFCNRKGIPGINVTPTARLMLACNTRPRFSDRSDGIWRRMLLIPFRVQIPESERVFGMDQVSWWEQSGELPAIFNWALLGLDRLRRQRWFTKSQTSEAAREDYREEMNPARHFLKDHLELKAGGTIPSKVLYSIYSKWAKESGHHALSDRQFGKEVLRCFPQAAKVQRGSKFERTWCYDGLVITSSEIAGEKISEAMMF